jgi:hypothetical protein
METGWRYCDDVFLVSLQFKNMILYNVSVKIDKSIAADWLQWMLSEHIPAVMGTGQFQSSRVSRLLDQPEDDEDETYVIQYQCESMDHFNYYISTFAGELRGQHNNRYKDRFVAFRTLMEVVGETE